MCVSTCLPSALPAFSHLVFTTLGNKEFIVHPIFQMLGLAIKGFKLLAKVTNV